MEFMRRRRSQRSARAACDSRAVRRWRYAAPAYRRATGHRAHDAVHDRTRPLSAGRAANARSASPTRARRSPRALRPLDATRDACRCAQALGRVLAADVVSPIDVPAHDNSAMDGYAFAGAELRADARDDAALARHGVRRHAVRGSVGSRRMRAHHDRRGDAGRARHRGAARAVPRSTASRCTSSPACCAPARTCASAAKTWQRGKPALAAGRVLKPADLGLVASLGIANVRVMRRLRVALFSTGDEIAHARPAAGAGLRLRQQPLQPARRAAAAGHRGDRPRPRAPTTRRRCRRWCSTAVAAGRRRC